MTNLQQLLDQIVQEEDELLSASHRRAMVRQRLVSGTAGSHQGTPSSLWVTRVLSISCALAVAAGILLWWGGRHNELTVTVGEGQTLVARGEWINAPETASLPLSFSDGSRIEVSRQSRMRLLDLDGRGAQLALESGRAGVAVAHGGDRRWELRAGPFVVHVTGTKFDVSWSPNEDRFELILQQGQVELAGCGFGAGQKLVAGQRVRAACHDGSVQIAYERPFRVVPSADPKVPAAPSALVDPAKSESVEALAVSPVQSNRDNARTGDLASVRTSWVNFARQGKYEDALVVVERLGFATETSRMSVDELALLAETARHARETNKARLALTSLRQRFPGTGQAGVAAFSLGVLEFDQRGAYAKAAEWFRAYLQENPSGPLTRESRGRLMEALQRSGSAEARGLALEYLRDYPEGPHAELAQRIAKAP